MKHSNQGVLKDEKGQEQPADKARAQTAALGCAHGDDRRMTIVPCAMTMVVATKLGPFGLAA